MHSQTTARVRRTLAVATAVVLLSTLSSAALAAPGGQLLRVKIPGS